MAETPALLLRPSRADDVPAVADLLLQLYHAEIPGAIRGPVSGQRVLMRHILARSRSALFRQYVVVDVQGEILGTASLRMGRDRLLGDLPQNTIKIAFRELGMLNALRLFSLLLRRSVTPDVQLGPYQAFLHSVVVHEQVRAQGVGAWLIHRIEQVAAHEGAHSMQLRVVVGNHGAKRLYARLGYRVIGRTPHALDRIAIPTELMHKAITVAA